MAEHYLKLEMDRLIQKDGAMWNFLQLGSLDGVWYWDLENPEHEWMSPEFWRLFGIEPETKRHHPDEWRDLIFQEDLARARHNFDLHCQDPSHPYDQIVRYKHASGSTVWVRCRGIAIRDESGRAIRMLGAHNDLTAVKKSEEFARAGWAAAEAANAELRTFAYSVSHDLKAPANTLQLLLSELRHEAGATLPDEANTFLDLSLATVTRMQTLVESVLDYTRIVGMEPIFAPVDLTSELQAAMLNLKADIESSGAQILADPLPTVPGIGNQIMVLFQNLLSNAIKFAHPDRPPKIRITCQEIAAENVVELRFKDNGLGIPEEAKQRIFSMFQRLHNRDEIDGFGLGLALCQRVAVNHVGSISVTSELDKGSEFTVRIARTMQ